jgi:hypothetical protein
VLSTAVTRVRVLFSIISFIASRSCRCHVFRGQDFYNFMNRFILISSFQNEKDLNGIPKIALRKSGTKTLKKNLWVAVELNFLVVLSSPKSVVGDPEVKAWIPANNPRE